MPAPEPGSKEWGMPATAEELLAKGKTAAISGQKDLAREYLGRVVQLEPHSEEAWLWLSGVANNLPMMKSCLERVLVINPHNQQAREGMNWVRGREAQMAAARAAAPATVAASAGATAPVMPGCRRSRIPPRRLPPRKRASMKTRPLPLPRSTKAKSRSIRARGCAC